jgi:WD40 repeat protein
VATEAKLSLEETEQQGKDAELAALENIMRGGNEVDLLFDDAVADVCLASVQVHEMDCAEMELNPHFPLMATCSGENCVKIWDIRDLTRPALIHEFVGHNNMVTSVALIQNDMRMLTASVDYNIHVYDVNTLRRDAKMSFSGSVLRLLVSPDERYVFAGGNDYDIKVYSLTGQYEQVAVLPGHSGKVVSLAVSQDGKTLASGGHDFNIMIWKIPAEFPSMVGREADEITVVKPYTRVEAHNGHVMDLSFNSSNQLASCSNDHSIRVWDLNGHGRIARSWCATDAHDSAITSVCWGKGSTANMLYTCSWDKSVRVWNVAGKSNLAVQVLTGHKARVSEVVCSASGKMLVSVSVDDTCRVWEAEAPYRCLCVYVPNEATGSIVSVACGSTSFTTGSEDGIIRVWPLVGSAGNEGCFKSAAEQTEATASGVIESKNNE